ncbi:DUF2243 domain-containing protein [Leptolyngbya sp. AN02str]|uniref:DUF2243 domain-containing protein n=1 Tax=Leptolyngbya sp. AN02str TaxID=3423363 RepID=UPI003D311F77
MNANSSTSNPSTQRDVEAILTPNLWPLCLAGLVLGIGQGGFFDGIVFHQLLQWHHMFSSIETDQTVMGMELNTLGDGLFHLFDWLMTLAGIGLLWRAGRKEQNAWHGRLFLGSLLTGAGIFNLVEGIVDHHILGIHHLKPGLYQGWWDLGFLLSGVVLIGIGLVLVQTAKPVHQFNLGTSTPSNTRS